jgi:hypothetical protein
MPPFRLLLLTSHRKILYEWPLSLIFLLYSPETSFLCFWYSFLVEAEKLCMKQEFSNEVSEKQRRIGNGIILNLFLKNTISHPTVKEDGSITTGDTSTWT